VPNIRWFRPGEIKACSVLCARFGVGSSSVLVGRSSPSGTALGSARCSWNAKVGQTSQVLNDHWLPSIDNFTTTQYMIDTDKFLNPERLKSSLLLASLYLTSYELLKSAVIDNIANFFSTDQINGELTTNQQYHDEITKVSKDLLKSSCGWLVKMDVITQDEAEAIQAIRKHRNEIAHELPKLLIDSELNLNLDYFVHIRELLGKIELWWVRNFEIPVNSDFDGVEIADNDIFPGRVVMLDYVISVVIAEQSQEQSTAEHPLHLTGL